MTHDEPSEMDKKFWEFHRKNPKVLSQLIALTDQAKDRGRKRIGMKMLFEVIRWNKVLETRGDIFKLNNNYTSRYVRLIEEKRPDLVFLFEKRTIKT